MIHFPGTLGVLFMQLLGALVEWRWTCVAMLFACAPFLIMLLFVPETPAYLIATEQIER